MASGWPPERFVGRQLDEMISGVGSGDSHVISLSAAVYRFCSIKYADRDHFTNGEGAVKLGGRFTPIGGPRTVYSSREIPTAAAEVESCYKYDKSPPEAFGPTVLATVAVSVGLVLDPCSADVLGQLGITMVHIAGEWRPACDAKKVAPVQSLGAWVSASGYERIRVPSTRHRRGVDPILFPGNFRDGSYAVVRNLDR